MINKFLISDFLKRFPDDDTCLEEIKKQRFHNGIFCETCQKVTNHYKIKNRKAYSCEYCRKQMYPLVGTIFEKSSTSLRIWFYALFIMTQLKGRISIRELQKELGVTYKTAWKMYTMLQTYMSMGSDNLLAGSIIPANIELNEQEENRVRKWTLFNAIEFKVVQKQEAQSE